jgi:trypsin-like peptidase
MKKLIVPLGWIGFIFVSVFYGRTIWDTYIEGKSSAAYLPRAAQTEPEPQISSVSVAPDVADLEAKLKVQAQRISQLEQTENISKDVSRKAARSVGLIIGEYIWTDATGHKPLRYAGVDAGGNALHDNDGHELVTFDGEGPIVVREFQGTGFLVHPRYLLTSNFLLSPWIADPLLDQSDNPERFPSIRAMHVYFPGSEDPIDLKIDHADEPGEAVLCILEHEADVQKNPAISLATAAEDGDPAVLLAYPGGVELLVARVPKTELADLYKYGSPSMDETAQWLAKHRLIEPITMQSRIVGHNADRIFFDAANSNGSTGGPLLNAKGQVVAVHLAMHNNYPAFNMATAITPLSAWINQTLAQPGRRF